MNGYDSPWFTSTWYQPQLFQIKVYIYRRNVLQRRRCLTPNFLFSNFWHGRMALSDFWIPLDVSGFWLISFWGSDVAFWLFLKSIKMVSWLPPIPDDLLSSWSKLSIAPWIRTELSMGGGTGVRLVPLASITLCVSPKSIYSSSS